MLNLIPHEGIKLLKEEAEAERLVESIFGKEAETESNQNP